ncbi:MAG: putative serine/threonine protein kinase [Gemmatimonadetes bacterium]|nr:putative serine/threonine protein kinase [Gemmatimonadota bacterium]
MTALKLCPTCGSEYPANERFCPKDGTALRAQGGGTDLVGSIIADRYHVLKKLGEGGMGQVYLAEHVKMGRKSAVKVMNPGMVQDADAISRFNREAANASRINHQHVAGIYDFGETADGLIYLAMEYVEGEPLTDLVQRSGALSPARAAELTRQTGEALAVAHDMGIVHRDLKPDNIMIARNRDGTDCVKVVDFGIAKAANVEAQKVTRTGLVVGTPEYMSPSSWPATRSTDAATCTRWGSSRSTCSRAICPSPARRCRSR